MASPAYVEQQLQMSGCEIKNAIWSEEQKIAFRNACLVLGENVLIYSIMPFIDTGYNEFLFATNEGVVYTNNHKNNLQLTHVKYSEISKINIANAVDDDEIFDVVVQLKNDHISRLRVTDNLLMLHFKKTLETEMGKEINIGGIDQLISQNKNYHLQLLTKIDKTKAELELLHNNNSANAKMKFNDFFKMFKGMSYLRKISVIGTILNVISFILITFVLLNELGQYVYSVKVFENVKIYEYFIFFKMDIIFLFLILALDGAAIAILVIMLVYIRKYNTKLISTIIYSIIIGLFVNLISVIVSTSLVVYSTSSVGPDTDSQEWESIKKNLSRINQSYFIIHRSDVIWCYSLFAGATGFSLLSMFPNTVLLVGIYGNKK